MDVWLKRKTWICCAELIWFKINEIWHQLDKAIGDIWLSNKNIVVDDDDNPNNSWVRNVAIEYGQMFV